MMLLLAITIDIKKIKGEEKMKITNVNTYLVRPRWGFVEIETDEGITGWGEPVIEGKAATVQACVEEM